VHGLPADDRVTPLADPVAEARRLIGLAAERGLVLRALGGVAVCLQAPGGQPRLPRRVKDIDLAAAKGSHKTTIKVVIEAGYVADEMFNALRGSRRLLFGDPANRRHLDVFVGEFAMCHDIPLTARLDSQALTVPAEELLLTKLQIVELTENDQSDIYNILFHSAQSARLGHSAQSARLGHDAQSARLGHDAQSARLGHDAISAEFIAALCAADWGLWRTCHMNIERSLANLDKSDLEPDERALVATSLTSLRDGIEAEPKPLKWRMRNQVGDRVRWYNEPEEEAAGT
jgi:hypothetical protein